MTTTATRGPGKAALLLTVAHDAFGEGAFSKWDLCHEAFQRHPDKFGQPGYPYASDNCVTVELVGDRGLLKRGWLEKLEPNVYRVTGAGMRKLRGEPEPEAPPLDPLLVRAENTAAYALFNEGRKSELTWGIVPSFWLGHVPVTPDALRSALEAFAALLADREDVRVRGVAACHDFLTSRFETQIDRVIG